MSKMALKVMAWGALGAANAETEERLQKMKLGEILIGDFKKPRNILYHRKFFALLDIAYDAFEPYGMTQMKNRERFRKDIIICAGFFDTIFDIDGNMVLEAKSMSFASMDNAEFAELYNAVVQTVIDKVLTNYTAEDVDDVVEEVIRF